MLRKLILMIFIALTLAFAACNDKAKQIPISDFFKAPEKSGFKISPDGKYISYLKPHKDKQDLFIESLDDGKERLATSLNNYPGRDYWWTYDNQIIFSQNNNQTNESKLVALDVATLRLRNVLSEKKVLIRVLNNRNKQQPDIITIEMNKRDSAIFDIYRLNIKNGDLRAYVENQGNITEWYPDADGKIRLAKASDGVDEIILYRPNDNSPFKPIIKNNFTNSVTPVPFTNVNNYFYALSNVNRDKTALVEINAENGKEEKLIYASDSADMLMPGYSRNKHRLDYAYWQEAKPRKHFLNAGAKRIDDNLHKHAELAGYEINITASDSAEDKFILSTFTDRNPGSVYLYESKTDKLTSLSDRSGIQPEKLCAMTPVRYAASDGLPINGYLTLPQNKNPVNLPVVVMPHDGLFGPFNRDSWGYNAEVQFFANRGFAVLQINYRGSTGYGKAFYRAGFKEVGGKIQQDITDGVNWLVQKKIANPKKIALFGRGFGGFSALYGLSFHPNLYSCAVVQNPLINFFTYIRDVPPFLKASLQMMYERVGDPYKDADQLAAISPSFHADKINAPLLIFQGRDPRSNISDLRQFVSELKRRNVPVSYKPSKPNERGAVRGQNRIEMYSEIEKFLDGNMRVKH